LKKKEQNIFLILWEQERKTRLIHAIQVPRTTFQLANQGTSPRISPQGGGDCRISLGRANLPKVYGEIESLKKKGKKGGWPFTSANPWSWAFGTMQTGGRGEKGKWDEITLCE